MHVAQARAVRLLLQASLLCVAMGLRRPLAAGNTVTLSSGAYTFDNALDLRCVGPADEGAREQWCSTCCCSFSHGLRPCRPAHAWPPPTAATPGPAPPRPPALTPYRPCSRPSPCSSYCDGRTLKLLYTLLADGTLSAVLVADVGSGEYAGLSFGVPHDASSPTVIFTTDFIGARLASRLQRDMRAWQSTYAIETGHAAGACALALQDPAGQGAHSSLRAPVDGSLW